MREPEEDTEYQDYCKNRVRAKNYAQEHAYIISGSVYNSSANTRQKL